MKQEDEDDLKVKGATNKNDITFHQSVAGNPKDDKKVLHSCMFCQNKAGRRRIEQTLREERNFISAVLDTVDALVLVLDTQGRIIRFNRVCKELTGYQLKSVKGKEFFTFLLPEEAEAVRTVFENICAGRYPNRHVNHWITKEKKARLISWSNTALLDREGNVRYIVSTGTDITESRPAQENLQRSIVELLRYQNVLREREKLAAIGQLAAGVTHEIKNPLTTIRGFTQLLLVTCTGNPKQEDYIRTILDEVDQVTAFIDDFLQLAGPKPTLVTSGSVNRLVKEIRNLIEPQLLVNCVTLECRLAPNLPDCMFDKNQMKQVLINLCRNAFEAMPQGGKLTLRTGKHQNELYIDILDTGCGIPYEKLQNIGTPFYTSKDYGTGLGLSISYAIVSAHKGRIEVKSQEGKGTRFRIYLPCQNTLMK